MLAAIERPLAEADAESIAVCHVKFSGRRPRANAVRVDVPQLCRMGGSAPRLQDQISVCLSLEGIINHNAQVSHGQLELGVADQQLHCAQAVGR